MDVHQHHLVSEPSAWVKRWTHLLPVGASVLDIACGHGRHMKWLTGQGCHCVGIDRSTQAIESASRYGTALQADIENGPWPFSCKGEPQTFDAVIVTNYLWRPLFPTLLASLAPGGLLLYETFAYGNETVGKPSRPDFLLKPAELLQWCQNFQVIAFEDGFLACPARFVQRIAAIKPIATTESGQIPERHLLSLE